jgi:hypothetical protein
MVHFGNYQWQPAPPGTTKRYSDISAPYSPLSIQNRTLLQDAVPSGIVASRVLLLQNSGSGKSNVFAAQSPSVAHKYSRDNSLTGFGRRLTNRFGQPAVRNINPDEDGAAFEAAHAFAGLDTPRMNHDQHHGVAEHRLRMARSSTQIHLLAQPTHAGTKTEGKVPWKSKSHNPMRRARNSLDIDILEEVEPSGNQKVILAQTSIFPLPANADEHDTFRVEMKSHMGNTITSDNSFATTSTLRRQSVRDLFNDYGIDRPAGLVSNNASTESGETPKLYELTRKCHLCAWINSDPQPLCWRCGHKLCSSCEGKPVKSIPCLDRLSIRNPHNQEPDVNPSAIRVVREKPVKQIPIPATQIGLNVSSTGVLGRKPSSIPSIFPELLQSKTSRRPSRKIAAPPNALENQTSRISLLTGTQTTTRVKESPFLIADSQILRQPLQLMSIPSADLDLNACNSPYIPRHPSMAYEGTCSFSDGVNDEIKKQDFPVQTTPYLRIAKNQLVVSSLVGKDKKHVQECTESGYVADTSVMGEDSSSGGFPAVVEANSKLEVKSKTPSNPSMETKLIEDESNTHLKSLSAIRNASESPDHNGPPSTRNSPRASQVWKRRNTFQDSKVPEFVECKGYPRVGHTRHDNDPFRVSMFSRCQSCLNGSPCSACQNANHGVRCSIHQGHRGIVHRHHTLQGLSTVRDIVDLNTLPQNAELTLDADSSSLLSSPSTASFVPVLQRVNNESWTTKKHTSKLGPRSRPLKGKQGTSSKYQHGRESRLSEANTSEFNHNVVKNNLNIARSKPVLPVDFTYKTRQGIIDEAASVAVSPTDISQPLFWGRNLFPRSNPDGSYSSTASTAVVSGPESELRSGMSLDRMTEKDENLTFPSRKISKVAGVYSRDSATKLAFDDLLTSSHQTQSLTAIRPKAMLIESQESSRKRAKDGVILTGSITQVEAKILDTVIPARNAGPEDRKTPERKLKLKLTDRRPTPTDGHSEAASRIRPIKNDNQVHKGPASDVAVDFKNGARSSASDTTEHDCVGRSRSIENSTDRHGVRHTEKGKVEDINISGITVVLHLEGREDLVIKAGSWKGGGLRIDGRG